MEGIRAYQRFNALKLHFTSDYDFFKYGGKTRDINESKFAIRKDNFQFRRLERRYEDSILTEFIVANLVKSNSKWVGDLFSIDCEKTYKEWKIRQESLNDLIKLDLEKISMHSVDKLWSVVDGQHPMCLKLYLSNKMMIETLMATNEVLGFMSTWTDKIRDDVIWPDINRLIKKYRPFIKIDRSLIKNMMKEVFVKVL